MLTTRTTILTGGMLLALAVAGCDHPAADSQASAANASPVTVYHCESGQTIRASYPDHDTAVVTYRGDTHRMTIAVSADGARYVGDGLEWWTKGQWQGYEGTLFRHRSDGSSGETLEQCEQQVDSAAQ